MLVKLLLEREKFEVLEAANGRDAVEIATRERPDLLVIDLNMPEMDGYEAIAVRIRNDPSLATMPILAVTPKTAPASSTASSSSGPTTTSSSRSIRTSCSRASTPCFGA